MPSTYYQALANATQHDYVNGYRVIMTSRTPGDEFTRPGRVILVDRGEGRPQRYVTAWQGDGDEGWNTGHYIDTIEAAVADFTKRAARKF